MDKPEFTEENLKKVFLAAYARAVSDHPDCEHGFNVLTPDDIKVVVLERELSIEVPSLLIPSVAAQCAIIAAKETQRIVFGTAEDSLSGFRSVGGEHSLFDNERIGRFVWKYDLQPCSTDRREKGIPS